MRFTPSGERDASDTDAIQGSEGRSQAPKQEKEEGRMDTGRGIGWLDGYLVDGQAGEPVPHRSAGAVRQTNSAAL